MTTGHPLPGDTRSGRGSFTHGVLDVEPYMTFAYWYALPAKRKRWPYKSLGDWLSRNPGKAAGRALNNPPCYHYLKLNSNRSRLVAGWGPRLPELHEDQGERPITEDEYRKWLGLPPKSPTPVVQPIWSDDSPAPAKPKRKPSPKPDPFQVAYKGYVRFLNGHGGAKPFEEWRRGLTPYGVERILSAK